MLPIELEFPIWTDRCAYGSWDGQRPSLEDYVTVTGATDGATAAGGGGVPFDVEIGRASSGPPSYKSSVNPLFPAFAF